MSVNAEPAGKPPDPAPDVEVDLSSTLGQGKYEELDALSTRRDALAGNSLSTQAAARAGAQPTSKAPNGAASSGDYQAPGGSETDRDDTQPTDGISYAVHLAGQLRQAGYPGEPGA